MLVKAFDYLKRVDVETSGNGTKYCGPFEQENLMFDAYFDGISSRLHLLIRFRMIQILKRMDLCEKASIKLRILTIIINISNEIEEAFIGLKVDHIQDDL